MYLYHLFIYYYCTFQPKVENELGSVNNYLEVKPSDFEVFEALAFDSTATREVTKGNLYFLSAFLAYKRL